MVAIPPSLQASDLIPHRGSFFPASEASTCSRARRRAPSNDGGEWEGPSPRIRSGAADRRGERKTAVDGKGPAAVPRKECRRMEKRVVEEGGPVGRKEAEQKDPMRWPRCRGCIQMYTLVTEGAMEEADTPNLPLDIIYQIPKYISDPASLARAASSCKIWRGVIRDSAFLDRLTMRHLDHGFTSSLLIGFFYQDSDESPEHLWQHHKDKTQELSYLELPSEVKRNKAPLLGNSADGALLLLIMKGLHMSMWKQKTGPGNGNGDWKRIMDDYCVMLQLQVDMVYKILSHIADPASLARLASTCKFWRNIIKGRSFLDFLRNRRHDHGFTPSLLLGFFYQDKSLVQHRKSNWHSLAPSFKPMSELSKSIGSKVGCNEPPAKLCTFIRGLGAKLNFCEPIASQDGFLALQHPTNHPNEPQKLCVCNPLTGEIVHIPPISVAPPDMYTLLVTEDVNRGQVVSHSFQLVPFWIGRRFVLGSYSSKAKSWVWFHELPELMPGLYVVRSPAAASHGAIHFLCGNSTNWTLTHIATLHMAVATHPKLSYLELPLDAKRSKAPLLSNSADGSFLLLLLKGLQTSLWKHGSDTSGWVHSGTINLASSLPQRVVQMNAKIRMEMFLGKSGAVVLWVDGEGLFLFSVSDGSMRKISNEHATKMYSFCPYEVDWIPASQS
nr:unnamed protein product [Digitaria exilis]